MSDKPVELVLVAPKDVFPLDKFKNGLLTKEDIKLDLWLKDAFFMERPKAEIDENFKQFIGYCVIRQNDKYFCYKRTKKGGEKRLHEQRSLAIGGHCNPIDNEVYKPMEPGKPNKVGTYVNSIARELKEELGLENADSYNSMKILGAIYDDSNFVGKVHIGLIHLISIKCDVELKITDAALSNGGFETLETIKKHIDGFEPWSQIIIKNNILV